MAARITHPDGEALGMTFGFMRKNVNNNRLLNPGSSLKQAVNRLGKTLVTRVSRQIKEIAGISRHETRTLMGRLWARRLGSWVKM
jgi:hypothetical protein